MRYPCSILPEGVRYSGAINIQSTGSVNRQKNLDKTNMVPVALKKHKTLELKPLTIRNENETFKYNTLLLVLVAHKPREGECQQVHTGVSRYHKNY
jgi:hypothetical protein